MNYVTICKTNILQKKLEIFVTEKVSLLKSYLKANGQLLCRVENIQATILLKLTITISKHGAGIHLSAYRGWRLLPVRRLKMRKQYLSAKQKDVRYVLATGIFFFVLTVSMVLHIIVEPSLLLEMNVSPLSFMSVVVSVVVSGIASLIPFMADTRK